MQKRLTATKTETNVYMTDIEVEDDQTPEQIEEYCDRDVNWWNFSSNESTYEFKEKTAPQPPRKQYLFCRWFVDDPDAIIQNEGLSQFHVSCGAALYDGPTEDAEEVRSEQLDGFFYHDAGASLNIIKHPNSYEVMLLAPAEPLLHSVEAYRIETRDPNWRYWLSPNTAGKRSEDFTDDWGIYDEDKLPIEFAEQVAA
jgi:hypothetical protein